MTKPTQNGLAMSESLYADKRETESNVANPDDISNRDAPERDIIVNPPPALLPEDPREAYIKGFADAERLFKDNARLQLLRDEVERRRKRLKKRGKI